MAKLAYYGVHNTDGTQYEIRRVETDLTTGAVVASYPFTRRGYLDAMKEAGRLTCVTHERCERCGAPNHGIDGRR